MEKTEKKLRVIMTALGTRQNGTSAFKSCSVAAESESIAKEGVEAIPFAIDDTRTLKGLFRNAWALRKLMKEVRPDVVHAHYGSSTGLITLLGSLFLAPVMISICGDDLLETPSPVLKDKIRAKLAILLTRFCAPYCGAVLTKSRNLYDALPTEARPIAFIQPNGVDIMLFQPMDRAEARGKLSLDPEAVYVLFNKSTPGNQEVKRPELARSAFELFREKVPKARFLELSSEPFERIPLYLNAADILLVTSLHEGSPNIVKEAMACNLPVVTVDCGDVVERLRNVQPGFIVEDDPARLAERMEQVHLSGKRSNGSEELLKQRLDHASSARNIISFYRRIARPRPERED